MRPFARWKYALLSVSVLLGLIYSLPNLFGEDPAVQIKPDTQLTDQINSKLVSKLSDFLKSVSLKFKRIEIADQTLLVRFFDTSTQLKAKELIKAHLPEHYSVALNLAPMTPTWLQWFGAAPMKLGLDLRGGVRFLMEVDIQTSLVRRLESYVNDCKNTLRAEKIRYRSVIKQDQSFAIVFQDSAVLDTALKFLKKRFPELEITKSDASIEKKALFVKLTPTLKEEIQNYTIEQTMTTLKNRVNELGVAESIVQRQGLNRIVVELPGVQDTAYAKEILGKTATLEFFIQDYQNPLPKIGQRVPPGSKVLPYDRFSERVLLKNRVILTGQSISHATTGQDENKRPSVHVRLAGGNIGLFKETTRKEIGRSMAVVYKEVKTFHKIVDGQIVVDQKKIEKIISLATIQQPLGNRFQITGLGLQEAKDLALLLRAGALPATIIPVEERIIGPSMGQENIEKGLISLAVGLVVLFVFMGVYYSLFGWLANITLLFNLVLLVGLLSVLGATLTLPGIAGIVLTLGMAVDANVLIFERIREEFRSGLSSLACIHRGFEHAFSTIVDANITTLIVGVILFAIGTGPVKGFAVTLSVGILTSLFAAVTGTRVLVELFYRKRPRRRLWVGI